MIDSFFAWLLLLAILSSMVMTVIGLRYAVLARRRLLERRAHRKAPA
ncbi:MAG: hypothetical protein MUE46_16490 [Xanthomonadales bacterium]|jgi:hypothetical protein|nr:hypothetical protein [Xanthomonadales bacterium]